MTRVEGLVILVLLGILGFSLVGFVVTVKRLFRATPLPPVAPPPFLGRSERLEIVRQVLGHRMPEDLAAELGRLRGWAPVPRPAAATEGVAPAASSPAAMPMAAAAAPLAAPAEVEERTTPAAPIAAAAGLIDEISEAAAGAILIHDERPLRPEPEVAAAAPHAHPLLRSFLSFENTIFLLAACLVLGGTLYVVATSWGRVPGRWQYLFLEGVILFYGSALLGAATFLHRRLKLSSAAGFLGATSAITMIAAAVVACASFMQYARAGLIGAGLVTVVGAGVARVLVGVGGGRARSSLPFGVALLLLAVTGGLIALDRPVLVAISLIAVVGLGGPLWLRSAGETTMRSLVVALGFPAAVSLFSIAGWLPATAIAPAIAAGSSLAAVAGQVLGGSALALTLVAVQAVAFGMAAPSIAALTSVAALGLFSSVALVLRAAPGTGEVADRRSRQERSVGSAVAAALWIALALFWARAVGLLDGDRLGDQAWAWNGAAAFPFALPLFWLAVPERRIRDLSLRGAEAVAWLIVLAALAMALVPFPELGVPSAAIGVAASVLAYGWARRLESRPRFVAAHASGLLAVWIVARLIWPAGALSLAATAALGLMLAGSIPTWTVGALAVPVCVWAAAAEGAPRLWLAALLAVYGAAHLLRPNPWATEQQSWNTRAVGPPSLLVALGIALFYTGGAGIPAPPLVSIAHWPYVLAAATVPMAAWIAWRGGPRFLVAEAMTALGAAALGGAPLPALALACGLLVGRPPGAIGLAAVMLIVLFPLPLAAHCGPFPCAALLTAAGAILMWRPALASTSLRWLRWLAAPLLAAAPLVLAFQSGSGAASRLAPQFWPLAAAIVLLPFAAVFVVRGGPTFLRLEVLVGAAALAGAALIDAYTETPATGVAILAGAGALIALGAGLATADRIGGGRARVAWVIALLLAPAAVVPMNDRLLRWPAALVGVGAVLVLGAVSRKRRAPDIGAWALSAGLPAVWWGLGAVARHFSHGRHPERILPALSFGTALYGMLIALDGRRLAAASTDFLRRFSLVILGIAGAALLLAGATVDEPNNLDATLALVAIASVGGLAVVIALVQRVGWPFYLAETLLGAGYAYLRTRTNWLDGFAGWDGVVACSGGVVCFAVGRSLRRMRESLGATESERMATLFPLLSSLLLRPHELSTAAGVAVAASLFAIMARSGGRPIYGWLAGLLANLALPPLWIHLDVSSPVAYALPAGVTLMILCRIYDGALGPGGPALRTVASLLIFASTSFELFQFTEVWPALLQGACAVAMVLFGIRSRVRAYLYIGFTALLLDIVANLTRWGMRDRLIGGVLGVVGGMMLFALGALVTHHKAVVLARYRRVQSWPW
jgi:hypothetical protein